MTDADALVIGGGLAGAAFAIELARAGQRVTVLERSKSAHHKVCGEFLSVETKSALQYIGADPMTFDASKINTLRVITEERGASAHLPFQASGLSRYLLDEVLLTLAGEAGAEIRRSAVVSGLEASSDGVRVHMDEEKLTARVAALATGKHTLRGFPRGSSPFTAFKIQIEVPPAAGSNLKEVVQLVIYDGGYIGACFVEGGLVTICWLYENRILKEIGPDWTSHRDYLSKQSTHLGDLLSGAKPQWERPVAVSGMPYGFLRQDVIAPNVYPLGDQLAVIPSYTGDGMAIALYSGIMAGRAIAEGRSAADYQAEIIAKLRPQFRFARAANLLFETAFARRVGIGISQWIPQFMTMIARGTRLRGFDL